METVTNFNMGTPIMAFPNTYLMVPLRGIVVMPHMTIGFDLHREKSITTIERAVERRENVMLVCQMNSNVNPGPKDIYRVGVIARIKQINKLSSEISRVVVEGLRRVQITNYIAINPTFEVEVTDYEDEQTDEQNKLLAVKRMLGDAYSEFLKLSSQESRAFDFNAEVDATNLNAFCYSVPIFCMPDDEQKQKMLEMRSLSDRCEAVLLALNKKLELLKVEKELSEKVRKAIDQNQKEFYLRERAKVIHDELGDNNDDLAEYRKRLEEGTFSDEVKEKINKEIKKLEKMASNNPEAGVSRNYIEWLLDVPWTSETVDNGNLELARTRLDEDHFGMEKVKERIIEHLAVMTLTKKIRGPILCFVGPPGVGKTSIAKSIARAIGRNFCSMSLGGVRDEAEIRGHRRTYIGAIPGGIMYHMKQAKTCNPVFLLDEIDKMCSDFRGDPASAMLEVLDPEQNNAFRDHYLEVAYDLSKVLFVTTANTLETIPAPLLDRMEVIELSGYSIEEKVQIADRYLIPKQCDANGIGLNTARFEKGGITAIVTGYTRESGVRNLDRNIGTVCRKIACKIVESNNTLHEANINALHESNVLEQSVLENIEDVMSGAIKNVDSGTFVIDENNIADYLGVIKFSFDEICESDEIGQVLGLAWTSVGGTILPVEVSLMSGGKGEIILTGKLGDVMKESARAAISVVRMRAAQYGIKSEIFNETDIHLHVPEGATPKDGPSAGITIATALLSAFCGRVVDRFVAMTGEITLRGRVLPIGGLREKILAAHRVGVKTVIIPFANIKDLADIPPEVRGELDIRPVKMVDEVFLIALKEKVGA